MKEIGMTMLMVILYMVAWKVAGFESAVCGGIGHIIAEIISLRFNTKER